MRLAGFGNNRRRGGDEREKGYLRSTGIKHSVVVRGKMLEIFYFLFKHHTFSDS